MVAKMAVDNDEKSSESSDEDDENDAADEETEEKIFELQQAEAEKEPELAEQKKAGSAEKKQTKSSNSAVAASATVYVYGQKRKLPEESESSSSAASDNMAGRSKVPPPPGYKPPTSTQTSETIVKKAKADNGCTDKGDSADYTKMASQTASRKTSQSTRPTDGAIKYSSTILVSNLDVSVTKEKIEELFSKVGELKEVRLIIINKEKSAFAYVEFKDELAAREALKLHRKPLSGHHPMLISSYMMPGEDAAKIKKSHPEMAQPSRYPQESIYFFRLASLLICEGTVCLRCIFDHKIGSPLSDWLTRNNTTLKNGLFTYQYSDIFAKSPPTSNAFDLSLLCALLKILLGKPQNNDDENLLTYINDIRNKRNKFYAHSPSCCISLDVFEDEKNKISDILRNLNCPQENIEYWLTADMPNYAIEDIKEDFRRHFQNSLRALEEKVIANVTAGIGSCFVSGFESMQNDIELKFGPSVTSAEQETTLVYNSQIVVQEHALSMSKGRHSMTQKEPFTRILSQCRTELVGMIESRFELPAELGSQGVLTLREVYELWIIKSVFDRNERLLQYIAGKSQAVYQIFLKVLDETMQQHVANYLRSQAVDADHWPLNKDQWPLNEAELMKIRLNLSVLDRIKCEDELLNALVGCNCISQRQMDYIQRIPVNDRNHELISIICRRSCKDFRAFIRCLREAKQLDAAYVLEWGYCSTAVVATVQSSTQVVPDSELVRQFKELLHKATPDETHKIEELLQLKQLGIDTLDPEHGSIILHFMCRTQQASSILRQWLDDGLLKTTVDKLFSVLIGMKVETALQLKNQAQLQKKYDDLPCYQLSLETPQNQPAPLEVVAMILRRASVANLRNLNTRSELHDALFSRLDLLMSVCSDWWNIMYHSLNCHQLHDYISSLLVKRCIQHWSKQLQQTVDPDYGLLDQLVKANVLSNEKIMNINSSTDLNERNNKLLDIISVENSENCGKFLSVLNSTGQQHVVNFIYNPLESQAEFGDSRPLDEAQRHHITFNTSALAELINQNDKLIADLVDAQCITDRHAACLRKLQEPTERNKILLDIMTRRSVAHVKKFVECLETNKQTSVSQSLKTPGEQRSEVPYYKTSTMATSMSLCVASSTINGYESSLEYFYGYLRFVLPRLRYDLLSRLYPDICRKSVKKFLILLPRSCRFRSTNSVLKYGTLLQPSEMYIPNVFTRAGQKNRDYKVSLYSIKDDATGTEMFFLADVPNTLVAMYEIQQSGLSGMTQDQLLRERNKFVMHLDQLLKHPKHVARYSDQYRLVVWDDSGASANSSGDLYRLLLGIVKEELHHDNMSLTAGIDLEQIEDELPGYVRVPVPGLNPASLYDKNKYEMTRELRGICLIINFSRFRCMDSVQVSDTMDENELTIKAGSEVDVQNLKQLFSWLKFKVIVSTDLQEEEFWVLIRTIQHVDHTEYDAFVCFVMSHGQLGSIYTTDNHEVQTLRIAELFNDENCPSLKGKPKMFFIQACQGSGQELTDNSVDFGAKTTSSAADDDDSNTRLVPKSGDFLMSYVTLPGQVSYRFPETGSVFIQAFVDKLSRGCHVLHALELVKRQVENSELLREPHSSQRRQQLPFYVASASFKNVYLWGESKCDTLRLPGRVKFSHEVQDDSDYCKYSVKAAIAPSDSPPLNLFDYDVYIGCSAEDRVKILPLKLNLHKNYGIRCCLRGSDSTDIQNRIAFSERCLLYLTPSYLRDDLCTVEITKALDKVHCFGPDTIILIADTLDTHEQSADFGLREIPCLLWPSGMTDVPQEIESRILKKPTIGSFPAMPQTMTGKHQALTYFYRFLRYLLNDFTNSFREFYNTKLRQHSDKSTVGRRAITRMLVLIPESCNAPVDLTVCDPHIEHFDYLLINTTRGGEMTRDYIKRASLYKLTDAESRVEFYFAAEFVGCLQTLSEIQADGLTGLSKEQMTSCILTFQNTLTELLDEAGHCRDQYLMLLWNNDSNLYEFIVDKLRSVRDDDPLSAVCKIESSAEMFKQVPVCGESLADVFEQTTNGFYKMAGFKRGALCHILDLIPLDVQRSHLDLAGRASRPAAERLRTLFSVNLNLDCPVVRRPATRGDLFEQFEELAEDTDDQYGAFVCCILAAAGRRPGEISIGAERDFVNVVQFAEHFVKYPTLRGKPKIFIFNAVTVADNDDTAATCEVERCILPLASQPSVPKDIGFPTQTDIPSEAEIPVTMVDGGDSLVPPSPDNFILYSHLSPDLSNGLFLDTLEQILRVDLDLERCLRDVINVVNQQLTVSNVDRSTNYIFHVDTTKKLIPVVLNSVVEI